MTEPQRQRQRRWQWQTVFGATPPERLGWLRALLGGWATLDLVTRFEELDTVARSDPSMFVPRGVTTLLPGAIDPGLHVALVVGTIVVGVMFALGAFYRLTGPIFAAALLFLMTYRTSWVQLYHSDNLMVLQILALALAPQAGEIRSIDAWRRGGRPGAAREGWEWMWPVALLCVVTVIPYFLAGFAKLTAQGAGLSWSLGDNLRNQIAYDTLNKELLGNYARSMARTLYDYPGLLVPAAIVSFWAELGAWTALLERRIGKLWSVATWGMHWGIYFVMGIAFNYPLWGIAFVPFFDVERPLEALRRRILQRRQP